MPLILHFGVGNFQRAHLNWYTAGDPDWRVIGVSLRNANMRDAMAPQGFKYTLATRDVAGTQFEQITVMRDILVAPRDPQAVLDAITDPDCAIISATVTEAGYLLSVGGGLDPNHPDVAADLTRPLPATLVGYLARGLAARFAAGAARVTVMSCDNLPDNGRKLRRAVMDFAAAAGLELGLGATAKIDDWVTFPNAMVDRITPATTPDLIADVLRQTGISDAAPVETERFSEWVIEDRFAGPHPDWAARGARFVDDVTPFEHRKLRLLNGCHSYLAYAGQLRGHDYVDEAIGDAVLRSDIAVLMAEGADTLPDLSRADAPAYCDALLTRWANPSLKHRLSQIGMDGSLKLPIRWLPVLALHPSSTVIRSGFAAWVRVMWDTVAKGAPVLDPRGDTIRAICLGAPDAAAAVAGLLDLIAPQWPDGFTDDVAARIKS